MYFCWQHTYYNIFDKAVFLRDMELDGKYFSKFLLMSILAHASHLCKDVRLRSDASDSSTSGSIFYEKAMSMLIEELTKQSLTTIQGLLLLASREAGIGRDSIGWVFSGMAFRMALDMGLHLDSNHLLESGHLSVEEYQVRNATLWGCYLFDQGWSTYMGRPSVIHMEYVTADKLTYDANEVALEWYPILSETIRGQSIEYYPHNTLTAIVKLSEIIEEIVGRLYAPKHRQSRSLEYFEAKVKALLDKLNEWEESLPSGLNIAKDHPSLLMLHTLYNTSRTFLFRPFIRMKKIAEIEPLEACLSSTDKIVQCLQRYDQLYGFEMTTNLAVYTTFTAATVLLAVTTNEDGVLDFRLEQCLGVLDKLSEKWPSARKISDSIRAKIPSRSTEEKNVQQHQWYSPDTAPYTDIFDMFNFDFPEIGDLYND